MTALKQDWRRIAARMRGDLDRAVLTGRARRLAEFAIKATLMRGRTRVIIPNRAELCRLLKIGQNHVAEVVAELDQAAIVKLTEQADGWELLVFPDFGGWRVEWMFLREQLAAYLAGLERAPGQCQGELLEPEPCLVRTLAEVSAENAQREDTSQNGKSGLPVLGSPRPSLKSSEFSSSKPCKKLLTTELLNQRDAGLDLKTERELLNRCRELFGDQIMANWGGAWRNRARQNAAKLERVLNCVAEDMRSSTIPIRNPSGHANDLWKRFHD